MKVVNLETFLVEDEKDLGNDMSEEVYGFYIRSDGYHIVELVNLNH